LTRTRSEAARLPFTSNGDRKKYIYIITEYLLFFSINGLILYFLSQQEWFCRLTQQCCFAGHPKDQKAKANMPHEAIEMLSVLNVKEVSDIVNHKVSFLPLADEHVVN